jgi:hypothetical protein
MRIAMACAGMLLAACAHAQQGAVSLGAGLHYSSGDYGAGSTTKITALAATARYEKDRWDYKATLPFLEVEGPGEVVPGVGRARRGQAAGTRKESGLGDLVLSATYAALYDPAKLLGVDLTGKLKLPTADESDGLGTGEVDAVLAVDLYRTFDRTTGFGGISYHILGDSPAFPLENAWGLNFGASYKVNERDSAGAMFETRQRVIAGGSPQREVVGFFARQFDRLWKGQAYALIGLADGSPDWGAGLSLARPF